LKAPKDFITHDDLDLQADLTYVEKPGKILEENWKRLQNRAIKFYKVKWKHHSKREATWEKEEELRQAYLELFRYTNS
jgi:hypothetical protein